ncbi:hypothetical protein D9611_002931 [Ephemerocybe angulata]|uniref:F-box domain-containing protein n=1 Tax=Ephemerocybe angulata TaxID=980116 RepID=A0A8H5C9A4_9AGAR|nr:hypothetical protein D9611_002931 [Tulosesus angulatus]
MGPSPEIRIHQLGLPDDIVAIARVHRELPPKARGDVEAASTTCQEAVAALQTRIDNLEFPKDWPHRIPLYEELAAAQERLNACQSLLSVKRRVPVETMTEIFKHYLDDDLDEVLSDRMERHWELEWPRKRTATTLCLVCQYWNTVALATPSLWSNIFIETEEQMSEDQPLVKSSHVNGLHHWMQRVGSHSWSLYVRATYPGYGPANPAPVTLAQLLQGPEALHLQRLTFDMGRSGLCLSGLVFPELTSIVVGRTGMGGLGFLEFQSLPTLPALTHAVVDSLVYRNTVPMNIPWGQLTHLYLGLIDNRQWKAIMKLCKSLQRGAFKVKCQLEGEPQFPQSEAQVTLRDLKELTFTCDSPFGRDVPMDGLSFPALEKIRIFSSYSDLRWELANVRALFGALTHLTILVDAWVSGGDIVSILNTLPQLQELYIKISEGYDLLFEYLTYGRELEGMGAERFRMRHLRALGFSLETQSYRPMMSRTATHSIIHLFPYTRVADLVASRTVAVRRWVYDSTIDTLQELEALVMCVDNQAWAPSIEEGLKEAVKPYVRQSGLRAVVCGPEDRNLNLWVVDPTEVHKWNHWDEGFLNAVEADEYSLYPKSYPFL